MCMMAVVGRPENEYLQSAGEVSRELNTPVVLIDGAEFDPSEDTCLCTVDVMAMAKNAGRRCEKVSDDWDKWAWIDYVIDPE